MLWVMIVLSVAGGPQGRVLNHLQPDASPLEYPRRRQRQALRIDAEAIDAAAQP